MTTTAWLLVGLTLLVAVADWYAVAAENRPLEYVLKPATMVALVAAAIAITPAEPSMRWWFVAALVCSLAGDVFLMLPDVETYFVPGLASFLVGHVLYIVGLVHGGVSGVGLLVGAVLTFMLLAAVGPTIVKGAQEVDRRLPVPVFLYILTISVMVTCAVGSGVAVAIVGAFLFYLSDFCIGWSRFVTDFRYARMAIITTYHLAQILLVVSLAIRR
ncbi:MAG: lysoplasmalogenase [Acidimicrobiales bacterium]